MSKCRWSLSRFFFFQAEDGIRDLYVTGVQTCALPIFANGVEFTDKAPDNHGASTTGNSAPRENHAFWTKSAGLESPNAAAGTGVIRPLEASARAKGVRFLLNYKMTSIVRELSTEKS